MTSSIDVPGTRGCAFCDYLSGRRPFTVLYRDSVVAALVTREQRGIGHVLVIPVAHRPTLLDLEPQEGSAIMALVISSGRAITDAYKTEGLAVWQNNGIPAHQAIPHVHFHVAGTLPEGGTEWGHVEEDPVAETDAIGERLCPFLRLPPDWPVPA